MEWTKEQQKVIELKDRNILVSAAAGSGKTAVLVERIIQKVTARDNPADIDKLLIVTFTKAAASEMKERIGKALEKKLMENPDNLHLQKQMTMIHNAHITTIHSFCKNLISNYFSVINLEPGMRLAEEAELQLLRSDVAGNLLERYYEQGKEEFYHFIEAFSTGKTDDGLENIILQLYYFSISYPWPKEWLKKQKDSLDITSLEEMQKTGWMEFLTGYLIRLVEELPYQCERAKKICQEPEGPQAYFDAIESDLRFVTELAKQTTYEGFSEIFSGVQWEKLKRVSKKDEINEEKQREVKAIRDKVKSVVEGIRKKFFFQPIKEILEDIHSTKRDLCILLDLAMDFYDLFQNEKIEKKIMDFNDLEHYALDILIASHDGDKIEYSEVARELSQFYDEIMIDEYQDSNYVQELILNSVSKERIRKPNIFMVGDVKQSIYKFRLARPELFMEKMNLYMPWEDGDSQYQRIDLHMNFRSRGIVLDFVNFIFQQIMQKNMGNVEYDQSAFLNEGAFFPESDKNISKDTEIILVNGDAEINAEKLGETEEQTSRELEARAIAAKIKNVVGLDGLEESLFIFDEEEQDYRKTEFGDIVILLRTVTGWTEDFIRILEEEGIPAVSDTRRGYFSALEVKTVLSMLQIIDNPRQDIPLAAVLHSPMFDFTSEELAKIKAGFSELDLYQTIMEYSRNGKEVYLKKKVTLFVEKLSVYRSMIPYTSICKMIEFIYEETGYYEYVCVMPAGEQRAANLDMLVKKAKDFENTSYKGLFQFNRYIEKLHKYDIDFGEAFISKDGVNAVKIMSIHKSKGLEFPVVFVSGLGKKFNMQDTRSKLILHEDLGLGSDYINLNSRIRKVTLQKRVIQSKIKVDSLGEELRVLYVALTRAKEKLILTGFDKKLSDKLSDWMKENDRKDNKVSYLKISEASSYLDFIGPCLYFSNKLPMKITVLDWTDFVIHEAGCQAESANQMGDLLMWDPTIVFNDMLRKLIRERLNTKYRFEEERNIPVKFTVSELKKKLLGFDTVLKREETGELNISKNAADVTPVPEFIGKKEEKTPVQKGIIYHKVMQEIRFGSVFEEKDLELELERMVKAGMIWKEEAGYLDRRKLMQFFNTDIANRMKKAYQEGRLFREKKFVAGMEAGSFPVSMNSREMVLIQGVIDAYIENEEEIVLIDYKTDYIAKGGEKEFVQRYEAQIKYYKLALEQTTGKKVREKYLYSFFLNKWFEI